MISDSKNAKRLPYYHGNSLKAKERANKLRVSLQESAKVFAGGFTNLQGAAAELNKRSKLPISPALLWKVVNGKCDSDRVRQALDLPKDPRTRLRPECSLDEAEAILQAIAGNPLLEDYSERLKRQVAKAKP